MDYQQPFRYHYRPAHGWINDPNGLVYFDGWYHVFYQHAPHFDIPWQEPMHWGHARTKDFLHWEELPLALAPDMPYDKDGCYSGTATVKGGILYLFYASIEKVEKETRQTVSVAYSSDGVHFEKYAKNPVIDRYPEDGCPDFRDPALMQRDGKYYCVMASGHVETKKARLLLYESEDLFSWRYAGILSEWENGKYAECPSFLSDGDKCILAASVCPLGARHWFSLMRGAFDGARFTPEISASPDKGPDGYAGQAFTDARGRHLLVSWIPGWAYCNDPVRNVGCFSVPREILVRDGRVLLTPAEEVAHLFGESDPAVHLTEWGFEIPRAGRESVVHRGDVRKLQILRDGCILEVFVNGGETVYSVLL